MAPVVANLSEFQKSLSFRKSRCFIKVLIRFSLILNWLQANWLVLSQSESSISKQQFESKPELNLGSFVFDHFYNRQKFLKCIYQVTFFVLVSIATLRSYFFQTVTRLLWDCYWTITRLVLHCYRLVLDFIKKTT